MCSICSKATDRPTQTEIVSKSVTVFIIFQTNQIVFCILRMLKIFSGGREPKVEGDGSCVVVMVSP